ncbi:unnamed protein product [Prorocentrum cordatum]|uniref:Selenoprotein O n=1 Tax=Prorocentrum cordatum TaxID=2364126 RepID=A0ABN9RII9_9DINO|nr:unnamed protein product [Polarella glacialis]
MRLEGAGRRLEAEALLERLLRALRSGAPAGPLVGAHLAEALVRGRGAFDEACGRVQAIAERLWEAPPLRAELLAGLLGAELRARSPAEAPVRRLVTLFEDVLALLQDGDPEKVEWWLRYVEFSQRLGLHGRAGEAPATTDLHRRAMRSVGDQPLYADRAHRLLGSAACG